MADIRINDLPNEANPTSTEVVAIDGVSTRKSTIQAVVNAGAPVASQADAQAGVDNTKRMTPLTTKQAFDSYAPIGFARSSLVLSAGTGLQGGGDLSADRQFSLSPSSISSLALADTLQSSRADAVANYHPVSPPNIIRTSGYYAFGDGGGASYKKVSSEPSHAGKMSISLQDSTVVWYEIADAYLTLRSFGAKGDGSDCTSEVSAAFNSASLLGRPVFDFGGIYTIDTINTPLGLYFKGEPGLTQFRPKSSGITMFNYVLSSGGLCAQKWDGFSIFCGSTTGVKGFQFTHANVFWLDNISFYGCETNYDIDRGGHFYLGCGGVLLSDGTTTNKSGRFKVQSSVDSAGIYGGAFAVFGPHSVKNNGLGVQSPAYHFRRVSAMRFQNNSIVAGNDGTGNNTGMRTGTCVLVENDCQGLVLSGVIAGYDKGLVIQTGSGSASNYPRVNDFSQLDIDQCFTQPLEVINGENLTFTDVHVTSSDVSPSIAGAVKIHPTVGKGVRFNNIRVSGYYSGSGTAILCEGTDSVTFDGGFIQGCVQGIAVNTATNLNITGIKTDGVTTGRVGNPGSGTTITQCVGIDSYDPWILSNPIAVPGSGAFGSASTNLRWLKKDTRNHFQVKVSITTNGTAAGNIQVPMPFTSFADAAGAGREVNSSGSALAWSMPAGSSTLFISKYDSTYPGGNNFVIVVSGCAESLT